MDVAPDLMASLRSRIVPGAKAVPNHGLDWAGLHARLSAAHAARQVLASTDSRRVAGGGGFDAYATTVQPAANALQRVNLTSSTDGKGQGPIAVEVAEQSRLGD